LISEKKNNAWAAVTAETDSGAMFAGLRQTEFSRLDAGNHVYLDYTGSGLYAESLIRGYAEYLEGNLLGNPHSENPSSLAATGLVEKSRQQVLDFFDADPDEYCVCFTANASAALRLVGEAYPFKDGSRFLLSADNHNSVHGIREYAEQRGATVEYISLDSELRLTQSGLAEATAVHQAPPSLFAYNSQSNFSGVKCSLDLIADAKSLGYDVFLDAAAFVPTNTLSLRQVNPDYVCVSFYKMFGFPTGVGALIVRHEALEKLQRPWFAGGTVEFVSVQNRVHRLVSTVEAFEDGTPNFLSLAAIPAGLDLLTDIGMDRIHDHVYGLMATMLDGMLELRHPNGSPRLRIYGPHDMKDRGATVAFNVVDADGGVVYHDDVVQQAGLAQISLRGGCFCNPGAAEAAFEFEAGRTLECFQTLPAGEFSPARLSRCLGDLAVGAVRASLGMASNAADVDRLLAFLASDLKARAPAGAAFTASGP